METYEEFTSCPKDRTPSPSARMNFQRYWTPPPIGSIKINPDASLNGSSEVAGIAAVFRNEEGCIIAGQTKLILTSSAGEIEAEALRLGLEYARSF
ncbi:hypothetical protein V6N13_010753 [Hibiscus sabdariffa]